MKEVFMVIWAFGVAPPDYEYRYGFSSIEECVAEGAAIRAELPDLKIECVAVPPHPRPNPRRTST